MSEDNVKDLIRQHWDRRAPQFDEQASHGLLNDAQHDAWRKLLAKLIRPKRLDVLDVGCGTGFLALLLAELGHRVAGVDLAQAMLRVAREKAAARRLDVRFLEGDAEAPPPEMGPVDLICMRHVIWTLPDPYLAAVNWRALLRPNGRVMLVEGEFKGGGMKEEYERIGDKLPFLGGRPAEDVVSVLGHAGFVDAEIHPLMDPSLWIETPSFPRYMVIARRLD